MDGEELMVPWVPSLPLKPVDGTCSVEKLVSPLRSVEGSSARTRFPRGRRVAGNWHRLWLLWSGQRRCVADLVCQMPKQFNWMLASDSC